MRNTDDMQDNERWQPLGKRIPKPAAPAQPEWKQKPGAAPGIEEDRNGHLRNNQPLPKG